jgi:hypothetical protein
MITSLPIHLSNHRPQSHKGLEHNHLSRCNHQRKTKKTSKEKARAKEATMGEEETDATVDEEVKDFFANWRETNRKSWRP